MRHSTVRIEPRWQTTSAGSGAVGADLLERRPDAVGVLLQRLATGKAEAGAGAHPGGIALGVVARDVDEQPTLPVTAVALAQARLGSRLETDPLADDVAPSRRHERDRSVHSELTS